MNSTSPIENLLTTIEQYLKTTVALFGLTTTHKAAIVLSDLASKFWIGLILLLSSFIASIGLCLLIGDYLGKTYYGFFIVAIGYLVVAALVFSNCNRWIKKPIKQFIIKTFSN